MTRSHFLAVSLAASLIAAEGVLFAAAGAAEPFIGGVFSDKKGCPSTDIHSNGDPLLLSAEGLEAIEYSCEFARVDAVFGGDAWLIQAACQEPGLMFPDQYVALVEERDAKGPTVLRLTDGQRAGATETRFYRCE